jgi:hypothetical protein
MHSSHVEVDLNRLQRIFQKFSSSRALWIASLSFPYHSLNDGMKSL